MEPFMQTTAPTRRESDAKAFDQALSAYHAAKATHLDQIARGIEDDTTLDAVQERLHDLYRTAAPDPDRMVAKLKVFMLEEADDMDQPQSDFCREMMVDIAALKPSRLRAVSAA